MLLPPRPQGETPGVPVRAGAARLGKEEKWGRSESDRPRMPLVRRRRAHRCGIEGGSATEREERRATSGLIEVEPGRTKAIYNTGQINSPENTASWMLQAALALLSLRSI